MRHAKYTENETSATHASLVEKSMDILVGRSRREIEKLCGLTENNVESVLQYLIAQNRAYKSSGSTRAAKYKAGPNPYPNGKKTTRTRKPFVSPEPSPLDPPDVTAPVTAITPFVYGGTQIRFDGTFMDATAMWRACGSPESLRPALWLQQERTKAYMSNLLKSLNVTENYTEDNPVLRQIRGGTNPRTEMHELLAIKYAQDLRPDFAVECNRFILAWGREQLRVRTDSITRAEFNAGLNDLEERIVSRITSPITVALKEIRGFIQTLTPWRKFVRPA